MNSFSEIQISKQNLLHNLKQFKKIAGKAKVMTVVKSNAYGHGLILTAQAVEPLTDWFGVAAGGEALELRLAGIKKPILVLNYYDLEQVKDLVSKNITLVVYDLAQAKKISAEAKKMKKKAAVHVKVGTGLSRLGVPASGAVKFIIEIKKLRNLEIEGLFSHFAASEDDPTFTMIQLRHFEALIGQLEKNSIHIPIKHIACTSSALAFPESRHDMVRIGLGTYGLQSYKSIYSQVSKMNPGFNLKPVLTWKAKILAVKELPVGAYVGYGRTYKTLRKTKLAILPVGYFEGYDRKLSNLGEVLVGGKRCKVRGRVYMNLLSVDVTGVKNVKAGDEAVLLGKQGREEISADELAQIAGTINYEIVTRLNPGIPRILK